MTCSISRNGLVRLFPNRLLKKNVAHSFAITNVKNPLGASGTGFFQVFSVLSNSVIDQNLFFYKMAFTDVSRKFELYGVDLGDSDNRGGIEQLYYGSAAFNLKDEAWTKNNGSNSPLTDHWHVGLTGQKQTYRFWLKEFNFERNQKFENLMAHCKNLSLLERRKFLFFDEEITDVVISQVYEVRVLLPRNLFGLAEVAQCSVGYFDEQTKSVEAFASQSRLPSFRTPLL